MALEHDVQQAKEEEQGFQVWESIWRSKVPGVVKDFAWRVCKNVVPCKLNLRKRGVELDPRCDFCIEQQEDLLHIVYGIAHLHKACGVTLMLSCPSLHNNLALLKSGYRL